MSRSKPRTAADWLCTAGWIVVGIVLAVLWS
jgi:hypothetical protein